MERYEYMKISLDILPEEIITQYNLCQLASNGWVYLEIRKGMSGLKQVHPFVGCELAEVVLGDDFFRKYVQADFHILVARHRSIAINKLMFRVSSNMTPSRRI